jgi:hypothetical protein
MVCRILIGISSKLDQFVVFLARATIGARPVGRDILPFSPGRYTRVGIAEGLVIDMAADEAHVFFHSDAKPLE